MASMRKVREFFDKVICDPEYGVEAFDEIVDEFISLYGLLFTAKSEKKKKFSAEPAKKLTIPKTE